MSTLSMRSSRPKQSLGGGGGDSPSMLDSILAIAFLKVEVANLVGI